MPRNANGGKLSPVATGMLDLVVGRWAGGGASNCTRTEGQGVSSVAIDSTGNYTLTLSGRYASLVGYSLTVGGTDGTAADMKVANMKAYSASAGTVTFSVSDLGATPALANLATNEEIAFTLVLRCQGDVSQ